MGGGVGGDGDREVCVDETWRFGVCAGRERRYQMIAPMHASRVPLRRMFCTFLLRTAPAERSAKPSCIEKTSVAAQKR